VGRKGPRRNLGLALEPVLGIESVAIFLVVTIRSGGRVEGGENEDEAHAACMNKCEQG
jgi:hypothetical protein